MQLISTTDSTVVQLRSVELCEIASFSFTFHAKAPVITS